jgi:hypothetical protein
MNTKQLQQALNRLKAALSKASQLAAQSGVFIFHENKIITHNGFLTIMEEIEHDITGVVQGDDFLKFINKIKTDELEMEEEKGELRVIAGKAEAGFPLEKEILIPIDHFSRDFNWKELPENFLSNLFFVSFSCAPKRDDEYGCIHVRETGEIEATDHYRVAMVKGDKTGFEMLIPYSQLKQLKAFKLTGIDFNDTRDWAYFNTEDGTIISVRLLIMKGKYHDIDKVVAFEANNKLKFNTNFLAILDKAIIFARDETDLAEISVNKKEVKLSINRDGTWFREKDKILFRGDPISFLISPILMKDILLKTRDCALSDDIIKFKGDDWVYVISLKGK